MRLYHFVTYVGHVVISCYVGHVVMYCYHDGNVAISRYHVGHVAIYCSCWSCGHMLSHWSSEDMIWSYRLGVISCYHIGHVVIC